MSDLDDLAAILRSHFPLVTVNTHEERRFVHLVKRLAERLDLPVAQWTVTEGLCAVQGDAVSNPDEWRLVGAPASGPDVSKTTDPEAALRVVRNAKRPGLFLMLDFHPFIDDPVHVRLLREIALDHDVNRQKLIFVSHAIGLPPELSRMAASFTLTLPDTARIGRIVTEESAIWATKHAGDAVRVDAEAVRALVTNLSGLTDTDARRLVRNAIYDDGAITEDDNARIIEAKRRLVGGDGLLSFEYDTARLADVGGFDNLKRWLGQRRTFFAAGAAAGTDRPKGVLLLGVQGRRQEPRREGDRRDLGRAVAPTRFRRAVQQVLRRDGA